MRTEQYGAVIAILSALFLGLATPFADLGAKSIGAYQMAVWASLASAAFLLVLAMVVREPLDISKAIRKYPRQILALSLARGTIGNLLFFYGFALTQAIRGGFILRLEPIFVTLFAFALLKEKVSARQALLIGLLIFGALLLTTAGDVSVLTEMAIGDLLIIGSLLFFAYSYIPAKVVMQEVSPVSVTIITNVLGAIPLLVLMPFLTTSMFTVTAANVWILLGYVLLFSVFGLYLFFAALKRTKPWIVSSLIGLDALVTAGVAYLWLGQVLNAVQLVGAAIIMVASVLIARQK